MIVVRYADHLVMGFQFAQDARRMLADLRERMAKFRLTLHEEKTRLIAFGRRSTSNGESDIFLKKFLALM